MLSLLGVGTLWVASVVDVHPRESIAGCIRRYVDRSGCFRVFLSSVHEVSAVSAIFSAFASDRTVDVLLFATPLQVPKRFRVAHAPHCLAAVPSTASIPCHSIACTCLNFAAVGIEH